MFARSVLEPPMTIPHDPGPRSPPMVATPVGDLRSLLHAIAAGDLEKALRLIAASPQLASESTRVGASRASATPHFLQEIGHYIYAGDTALHIAAAAYRTDIARALIVASADIGARNRRGAEPLHYAADGRVGSNRWNSEAQAAVTAFLLGAGANPDAADKNGVTPLHRAVRTRTAAAVGVLLTHGADPRRKNKSGSTPLHLAVQNTGRGGSGTAAAREQQAQIIRLLLDHGARPSDTDDHGKTVAESIATEWILALVNR